MSRWTQRRITDWAVSTFGAPSNPLDIVTRALDESQELFNATQKWDTEFSHSAVDLDKVNVKDILKEMADIVIILKQAAQHLGADLDEEVDEKMDINVERNWVNTGTGVGRHV